MFPSLRATVVEVIRLAADPNRSDEELFRVVSGDPGLSIQVLRFANSAAFRPETEVTSVARAVSVIGSRALRNIAICLAACESTPPDAVGQFDFAGFLEDSLRRGAAAELLASYAKLLDPEEAFTAGLLQDFGLVALVMHEPSRGSEWNAARTEPAEHRRELERALFGRSHDDMGDELADQWKLPETLAVVMRLHHQPERAADRPESRLVAVCHTAEQLADIFVCDNKQQALEAAHARLRQEWGLTAEQADALVAQIPARVELYADAMGIHVPEQSSLEQIVEEIRAHNRILVQMNLDYQQETQKLVQLLREKEEIERELRIAKARLERLATTDPLTLLPNRRHFEITLERELSRAAESGLPVSVIIGDIDYFKSLNDTYGHPFGDLVLRAVGKVLRASVRSTDMVARIGGEEFAVLVPTASRRHGMDVGERLRRAIEGMRLNCSDSSVRVTISFGGSTLLRVPDDASFAKTGYVMLAEADQALYSAKRSGRNRVAWRPKPVDVHNSSFLQQLVESTRAVEDARAAARESA